jgi:hypothetical protein
MKQNALTQFRDNKNFSKTYEKFLLQLQYSGKHMRASAATFRRRLHTLRVIRWLVAAAQRSAAG